MTPTLPIIIVVGPQGSGKGTQVDMLSKTYGIPSVGAGDLLRQAAAEPTEVGQKVKALIDNGHLVTIDLWQAVVGAALDKAELSKGYILEGVVRTLEQVKVFESLLMSRHLAEPWVLSIELVDDIAVERLLKRGRNDDTEQMIRTRLDWSRTEVQPVIEYYRPLGRLVTVNGDQSIEAVHAEIIAKLVAAGALPEAR